MHARTFLWSLLGAAGAVASDGFAAAPSATRPAPTTSVVRPSKPVLWVGAPKDLVAARFGMPSEIVSPELWIYREFATDYRNANQRGFDTLVVVFRAGKVDQMRVVNGETLTAVLEANRRAQARQLAAIGAPGARR